MAKTSLLKKWRIGDYIRQLSVVVIGILITFQGSAWIDKNHKRKEANEILTMVRDELNINLRVAKFMDTWLQKEIEAMDFFKRHMDDIRSAPVDSLRNYMGVLVNAQGFGVTENALQVLRTSQSSNVIDKKLLNDIFRSYGASKEVDSELSFFSEKKTDIISTFLYNQDRKVTQSFLSGENVYPFLINYLNDAQASNYIISCEAAVGGRVGKIKALVAVLENTLGDIDNYIK
ncbi:hypothetical protein [uncultured Alistipes sp.]|jgi:hypothetical protein|uniref:hypothetical protein n=1 Tax=uncultured Alistipes sp. TaxID=538949 RepID=UPI0025F9961C|nr:hypothetical protein [uncultured Alistipes sp.]